MLLFHKNRYREVLYKAGDEITIRIKGNRSKFTGQIKAIDDTVIVFQNYRISPREITDIYVDDKTKAWFAFRYKYPRTLLILGAGYLLLDVINTGEFDEGTVIISTSLIGAAVLTKLLIGKRIRKLAIIGQ